MANHGREESRDRKRTEIKKKIAEQTEVAKELQKDVGDRSQQFKELLTKARGLRKVFDELDNEHAERESTGVPGHVRDNVEWDEARTNLHQIYHAVRTYIEQNAPKDEGLKLAPFEPRKLKTKEPSTKQRGKEGENTQGAEGGPPLSNENEEDPVLSVVTSLADFSIPNSIPELRKKVEAQEEYLLEKVASLREAKTEQKKKNAVTRLQKAVARANELYQAANDLIEQNPTHEEVTHLQNEVENLQDAKKTVEEALKGIVPEPPEGDLEAEKRLQAEYLERMRQLGAGGNESGNNPQPPPFGQQPPLSGQQPPPNWQQPPPFGQQLPPNWQQPPYPYWQQMWQPPVIQFQAPTPTSDPVSADNVRRKKSQDAKGSIPQFKDGYEQFFDWLDAAERYIEVGYDSDKQMFQNLKKTLEGRAKELVEHLSTREPRMIELLLDTLKKEYGDVQYLSGKMRKDLMEMGVIGFGADNLRKYLHKVSEVRSVLAKAGEPVDNSNDFLSIVKSRLPRAYQRDLNLRVGKKTGLAPLLEAMQELLEAERIMERDAAAYGSPLEKEKAEKRGNRKDEQKEKKDEKKDDWKKKHEQSAPVNVFTTHASQSETQKCPECGSSQHNLPNCEKFKKLNVNERLEQAEKHRVHYRCLTRHPRGECTFPDECPVEGKNCKYSHHELLHGGVAQRRWPQQQEEIVSTTVLSQQPGGEADGQSLRLVQLFVRVQGSRHGKDFFVQATALLDGGSTATIIKEDVARRLGARLEFEDVTVSTLNRKSSLKMGKVNLEISPDAQRWYNVTGARTTEKLNFGNTKLDWSSYVKSNPVFKGVDVSDHDYEKINLLVGRGLEELFLPIDGKQNRRLDKNRVLAVKTRLGWTIAGPLKAVKNPAVVKEERAAVVARKSVKPTESAAVTGQSVVAAESAAAIVETVAVAENTAVAGQSVVTAESTAVTEQSVVATESAAAAGETVAVAENAAVAAAESAAVAGQSINGAEGDNENNSSRGVGVVETTEADQAGPSSASAAANQTGLLTVTSKERDKATASHDGLLVTPKNGKEETPSTAGREGLRASLQCDTSKIDGAEKGGERSDTKGQCYDDNG
jgi:hypothetical protein